MTAATIVTCSYNSSNNIFDFSVSWVGYTGICSFFYYCHYSACSCSALKEHGFWTRSTCKVTVIWRYRNKAKWNYTMIPEVSIEILVNNDEWLVFCCCFSLGRHFTNLVPFNKDPEGRIFSNLLTVCRQSRWKKAFIINVLQRASPLWWMSLKWVLTSTLYCTVHDVRVTLLTMNYHQFLFTSNMPQILQMHEWGKNNREVLPS